MIDTPDRAEVALGNPSFVWRAGQDRRLNLIRRFALIDGARVLDIGCGLGVYVRKFQEIAADAYGVDIDPKRLRAGASETSGLLLGSSEDLPFKNGAFDTVVLNEVIEHVRDDKATLAEALRVVRAGGCIVIFAPNRLYPFETHGIYLGERFVFGNIPFVNWMPDFVRNKLVPHARAYTRAGIRNTYRNLAVQVDVESYVYPGFDNVVARRRRVGGMVRRMLHWAEGTPLKTFGLSHFIVLRKKDQGAFKGAVRQLDGHAGGVS
jgi:ubiquinone/menaquinone biosynthesis C-methylase UbiE